jgi:hypothetical protein
VGQINRREILRDAGLVGAGISTVGLAEGNLLHARAAQGSAEGRPPKPAEPVELAWLAEQAPARPQGVSWGVPWPMGTVAKDAKLQLRAGTSVLPLQSWPVAYWPDGSLKWSGLATVVPAQVAGPITLQVGETGGSAQGSVKVAKDAKSVRVDTGALACTIPLSGANLLDGISIGGKPVSGPGRLVCILQSGPEGNPEDSPKRERFVGEVKHVEVEQNGPVRAVVKIEGMHRGTTSKREWLPFTVRLYFYSGQPDVRLVHTIIFDGDQEKDFVRGLGLEFDVPMRDDPKNRTVRFGGEEGGVWSEPLQPGGGNPAQENGETFTGSPVFEKNAIWTDFRLMQPNPDGFTIVKRTNPASTWLFSAAGKRATGHVFAGDLGGGLGLTVRNFWESFPSGLEIRNASTPTAKVIAWLWSPDAPAMDMRFYDTHGHGLDAAYEDAQPGLSTAHGVARTSEMTLHPMAAWPTRAETAAMTKQATDPALLRCSPEYIHAAGVFGVWSLPDRSTAFKKSLEDGLDSVLAYYQRQVDERSWYGFWQYGDFIHSYSGPRHLWHYDWGGHAWDNTELGAPLWLWYSYLRTGRADLFRLAEAHLRNTSETDVYHLGPIKGLGSRHNVVKWGDGAKEARISQAAHWRIFYYLTTDERTGDIMHMVSEAAGESVARFDPMREASPLVPGEPKIRIRIGPDWFAIAGNWMTEWERTGDTHWRDKILAGVNSIVAMPFGLETGKPMPNPKAEAAIVGFDNATGKLTADPDPKTGALVPVNYNLATIQGGAEVMFEMVPLLGRKDLETEWLRMCRLAIAPPDVWTRDKTTGSEGADGRYVAPGQSGPRLAAYAYAKTDNKAYAEKAISMLMAQGGGVANVHMITGPDSMKPVQEDARMSTNEAAQTGLSTMEVLELCKDALPTAAAVRTVREFRGRPTTRPTQPQAQPQPAGPPK